MASPCSSPGSTSFTVVGNRLPEVGYPLACFAEGGIAGGVGTEEVVAMDAEGLVDPAGSDPGGLHPLLFALFPGSGDDVSFQARPFRGARHKQNSG